MAVSQHFITWTCSPSLNNHFLYYWLQSHKAEFERIAMGGTIKTIGLPYFRGLVCPVPGKGEQDAIAEVLSDADAFIESLEQLIVKKRDIKRGATQELLRPKVGWEHKRIGDLLTIAHGKSQRGVADRNGSYPILATGGQIGTASRFLYDKPSVLIGRKGTIDRPQYMDKPFWTVDTLFYSVIHEPNCAEYIFYQFCLIDWNQHNEASGVPSLNARTIERIVLKVPPPERQMEIAAILSDMDAEITVLEAKLTKARQIKRGMMNCLLSGKIRLSHRLPAELDVFGGCASLSAKLLSGALLVDLISFLQLRLSFD